MRGDDGGRIRLTGRTMSDGSIDQRWRGRGDGINNAYKIYRRVTFDFPDSKWAKHARGRLSDPAFAKIIEAETKARERMVESLKYEKKKR